MAVSLSRWAVVCGLGLVAWKAAVATNFAPTSWAIASLALWLSHTTVTGWRRMSTWEQRHLLWGMTSLLAFLHFLLLDPSFQASEAGMWLWLAGRPQWVLAYGAWLGACGQEQAIKAAGRAVLAGAPSSTCRLGGAPCPWQPFP